MVGDPDSGITNGLAYLEGTLFFVVSFGVAAAESGFVPASCCCFVIGAGEQEPAAAKTNNNFCIA
jgi:hypothetical protein